MKRFFSILAAVAVCISYTGCEESGELWDANNELEGRVDALEEGNFAERVWEKVFVGSWGRKVTTVFASPEDFVLPGGIRSEGGMCRLYPQRHGTDGFFIAKFRKIGENEGTSP